MIDMPTPKTLKKQKCPKLFTIAVCMNIIREVMQNGKRRDEN